MSGLSPFTLGLLVGRFQMLHLGHQYMIDTALAICDRVGILVGSSQESGTAVNPFSYEQRKAMLLELYGDRIEIAPLPDIGVGNNSAWGDYVLEKARKSFGATPDLVVSGAEGRRISWFHESSPRISPSAGTKADVCSGSTAQNDGQSHVTSGSTHDGTPDNIFPGGDHDGTPGNISSVIAELYLPKTIDISASRLRSFLLEDNYSAWSKFTDPRFHTRYQEFRAQVLAVDSFKITASL